MFAVLNGRVLTPRDGALEGVIRRTVLELAAELDYPTVVDDLATARLGEAGEVFFTSTAGGIMPVRSLDHARVGVGGPGAITMRLRDAYWSLHDDERFTTEVDYGSLSPTG